MSIEGGHTQVPISTGERDSWEGALSVFFLPGLPVLDRYVARGGQGAGKVLLTGRSVSPPCPYPGHQDRVCGTRDTSKPPPQDCTRATACEAIVGSEGSELGSSNVPWWVVWLDLWYCRAWRAWGLGSELRMGFWGKG